MSINKPWTDKQWQQVCDYREEAERRVEAIILAHQWVEDEQRCICRNNFNINAQTWHVAREIVQFDLTVDAPPLLAPEWMRDLALNVE